MELPIRWVKWYAWFVLVFALGAGIIAYISPENMFSMLSIDFDSVSVISNGFAARNIAIAVFAAFTIWSNNAYVYLGLFITRLAVDSQDLMNALIAGPEVMNPLTAIVSLCLMFIVPLVLGIIQLKKIITPTIS